MESTSLTFNAQSLFPFPDAISRRRSCATTTITVHQLQLNRTAPLRRLQFARRLSRDFHQQGDEPQVNASRNWGRSRGSAVVGDYYRDIGDNKDDDDDDEEEEDRSLDLLVKFVENVFKKVSKRARKAVRSVLPLTISTKLVVCTLGSVVFVSILVIRGVWTGISFLQENRNRRGDELDDPAWGGAQPVT